MWRIKCIGFIVEKATAVFAVGDTSVEVEFVRGNLTVILKVLEMTPDILAVIQCCWDLTPWRALKISDLIRDFCFECGLDSAYWTQAFAFPWENLEPDVLSSMTAKGWIGIPHITLCFLCEYCRRGRYLPCFVLVTSLLYPSLPPTAKHHRPSISGSSVTPLGISEAVCFQSALWLPLLRGLPTEGNAITLN